MERSNELCQPWLKRLINIDFYGHNGICEVHNQYCTLFCKKCTNEPLCESCWKVIAEVEHEGHQFLQIFKVSGKASVRKADIERGIDVTNIQPYTINGHKVMLLKPKGGNGGNPKCDICQGRIKDERYQFCSISCKITRDTERLNEYVTIEEIEAECLTQCYSLRKRPRKRRPWRSPMF